MNRRMSRDLLLKLEMRSDPSMLSVVRGVMERLTEVFGFSAAESRSVTRAVDEAITNIMRHAYKNNPDKPIDVHIRRLEPRTAKGQHGNGLEILLSDRGPA